MFNSDLLVWSVRECQDNIFFDSLLQDSCSISLIIFASPISATDVCKKVESSVIGGVGKQGCTGGTTTCVCYRTNKIIHQQTILFQLTHHTISKSYFLLYHTRGYQSDCIVGVARVVETSNKKSHQGDAMGGRIPPTTVMAINNNCHSKQLILVGDHFAESKFLCFVWAEFLCFLYRFLFMVHMPRCGKPQMKE